MSWYGHAPPFDTVARSQAKVEDTTQKRRNFRCTAALTRLEE